MKKIILLSLPVLFVGCATPSYNVTSTITGFTSKPPIGEVVTVGVGEQMLFQGNIGEDEVLEVSDSTKVNSYTIHAGTYAKTGNNEKGDYFSPVSKNGVPISKTFIADPFQVIMVSADKKLCVVTILNAKMCTATTNFKVKKVTAIRDNSFQQTLIYSGKVGNKINIGYREFTGNMARPAFNNDVEYDLSESKEIGYKGALLQILDANNQSIKYKVLKNFNKTE
ncbi:hypothetical protein [Acinetobacter lactucae]|uniref:hypothetical protein n=1 Tax=Acinetobacter lactucae TaxID=1785128 RepID=UPI0015810737|nr:hypothetical protein [Acinetobacter lactucae]NUG50177.1 hypothetical protein [Acinetobacter lactucae]